MTERLEDILGGVEEEIRRAEERLRLAVTRPKSSAGTRARPASGEGDRTGASPLFEARSVEGATTPRESVARRLLQDALLPGRRAAFEKKPRRRRAWVDLEKDCRDTTSTTTSSGGGGSGGGDRIVISSCNSHFNGSQGRREAIVERLLKEREARLRSTMASATTVATDTDVERTGGVDFFRTETTRDRSDGNSSGGGDDSGRNFGEEDRQTSWRENCNSPGSRGDDFDGHSGFSGVEEGIIPVSDQGNIFFASDIVDAEDHTVDSPRGEGVDFSRLLSQGGRASESPRRQDHDRIPRRSLPSLSNCQGGTPYRKTSTMNKPSHGGLPTDSLIAGGMHEEGGGGSVGSGRAGDRRESDARELGGEEEEDQLAAARRLEDLLSFRPRLDRRSSLQMKTKPSKYAGGGGGTRRIEELARSRRVVYCEREQQRKKQEEEETKECTFRPKITATLKRSGNDGDSDGCGGRGRMPIPLHERLHREARGKEAARALAQLHLEAKALRECTFQPLLNAVDAATPVAKQRPLHERVWEVEREREHNLRLLQADKDEREGATFAPPPLGRVSQRLLRNAGAKEGGGRESGGVTTASRLQEQASWARERRRLRLQEREEAEAKISTFEPRISRGTESIVRRRPELRVPFEQRQAIMGARAKERERRRFAVRADEERRWFIPPTARRTEALLRHRMPERLEETVEQRVERMASAEDKRRREFASLQRAKERRECTFRPSLNPVTQSVGRAAPLDELVNNRRGQRVRERAEAKIREQQTYPHKPILLAEAALLRRQQQRRSNERPSAWALHHGCGDVDGDLRSGNDYPATRAAGIGRDREGEEGKTPCAVSLYGPDNRYRMNLREPWKMTANLRARERQQGERVCALRQKQEATEMLSCTFAPQTNHRILRAQGPVLVRGLGRHLELKDIAQQREEERREREAQAFGVRPGAVRRTALGETVLKPFSLSEGNSKGWWEERRRRHEKERAAQYPFKPWTVERERSRALSRLLEFSSVLASSSSSASSYGVD